MPNVITKKHNKPTTAQRDTDKRRRQTMILEGLERLKVAPDEARIRPWVFASALGVSTVTIYRRIASGELKAPDKNGKRHSSWPAWYVRHVLAQQGALIEHLAGEVRQ